MEIVFAVEWVENRVVNISTSPGISLCLLVMSLKDRRVKGVKRVYHMVWYNIKHEIHPTVVQRCGETLQVVSCPEIRINRVTATQRVSHIPNVPDVLYQDTHISCCQYPWYASPSDVS
jgi:hypothetical protein